MKVLASTSCLLTAASLVACGGEAATGTTFRNVVTGALCTPDPDSFVPRHGRGRGDNRDDPHSGKIDCLGDGNSGAGDDSPDCRTPALGCDANGCCAGNDSPSDSTSPQPDCTYLDDACGEGVFDSAARQCIYATYLDCLHE